MARKTQTEIAAEVAALTEMGPKVRHFTIFGDDNHAAIQAQIDVLVGNVDEGEFEDKVEEGEWTEHERDNAQQAQDWMDGYSDGPAPSSDWAELVQK